MKNILVKIIFEVYVRFGKVLKKIIPISWRNRIKLFLNNTINEQEPMSFDKISDLSSGINLVGYIRAEIGLGHSCRLLGTAIEVSGINWCAINYEKLNAVRYTDEIWSHKIVQEPLYNTNIININPDNLYLANLYLPKKLWKVPYTIGYYLWELMEIPDEWIKGFDFFDEIWAPSQFIIDSLKKATNKPILKVPYGITVENYSMYDRSYFGLPNGTFLFLTMYDVNSTSKRKNPKGTINAFKNAFNSKDKNVGLVVKINNANGQAYNEINEMKESLIEYENIFFIENVLDRNEVNSLLYCIDVFVSLHRAEGFGLVIAESMYLGKPVIATNWSANIDFMNVENSCPIDYELVEIEEDIGPYKKGQLWAEPNGITASEAMKKMTTDKILYKSISINAEKYIKENYSFEESSKIIKQRLEELNLV